MTFFYDLFKTKDLRLNLLGFLGFLFFGIARCFLSHIVSPEIVRVTFLSIVQKNPARFSFWEQVGDKESTLKK